MFGEAGISGLRKRAHVIYTRAHHALKMSHNTISPTLEIERLLLPGSFTNASVDSMFVANTFEHVRNVQSSIDDLLQC